MNTKALRQKILDLAIHGKLVPQNPNDEPASVLLERIKAEKERLIKEGKIKRAKRSKAACDKPHYEIEMPFEVPSSWTWCKLGDLCVFLSRGKSPKYLDEDRRYPVFAQKCNLKEGGISLAQARFLDPTTINKWDEVYRLKTGDVLVNSTGTGTVGRTRLFNESCLGDYPFVVPDSHVSVVRTADEIMSEYIYAYMSSNVVQEYLEDNLAGSTNQKELYIGVLDNLQIPLPPYVEQKRIVLEIDKWYKASEAIENGKSDLEKIIKQTKSKILDLAIHGKLVPQDPMDEPASELLKRINPKAEIACDNAQYGKLPNGWCMTNIESLFEAVSAKRVLKSEWKNKGIPFYRAREIVQLSKEGFANKDLFVSEEHYAELKEKYGVPICDDIMISAVGSIGYTYIVKKKDVFYYKDASVICLKNINHWNPTFFTIWLASPFLQEQMYKNSKGTTVATITLEKLKGYAIPLPPLQEQHRIAVKIEELFSQLDNIASSL